MRGEGGGAKRLSEIALRYKMRDAAQWLTSARGVEHCGRRLANPMDRFSVSLRVHVGTGRPSFGGLARCNSIWECPVCAPRVQAGRAEELRELNAAHVAAGGALYMATLTLPHNEGDALRPLRVHVAKAWSAIKSGAPWQRWKARLGLVGDVRALEVTHGPNGWHPHLHAALYTLAGVDDGTLEQFEEWLWLRWCAVLQRRTRAAGRVYRMPSREHGVRVEPLRQADYLAKMGLAHETSSSWTKEGRAGHRTPMQILRDIALGAGDPERRQADISLWRHYARAMKGARQLIYSRGLRARYALGDPLEDAELPDTQDDLEGLSDAEHETVYSFDAREWDDILAGGVGVRVRLLAVPLRVERALWQDAVLKILDAARGLPAVPF